MQNRVCYANCIHYGTQFERHGEHCEHFEHNEREERHEDRRYRHPLYMRLRRHVGRRHW